MSVGNIKKTRLLSSSVLDWSSSSISTMRRVSRDTKSALKHTDCKQHLAYRENLNTLLSYKLALNSDDEEFGGHKRLDSNQIYQTYPEGYAGRRNHIPGRLESLIRSLIDFSLHSKSHSHRAKPNLELGSDVLRLFKLLDFNNNVS